VFVGELICRSRYVDEVCDRKRSLDDRRVCVFVVERESVLMVRREGLYSRPERCLGAKREWRSMNNAGRTGQALLEEAGNRGKTGLWKQGFSFIIISRFYLLKSQVAKFDDGASPPSLTPFRTCRDPMAWPPSDFVRQCFPACPRLCDVAQH
jgi:hypothetical protein